MSTSHWQHFKRTAFLEEYEKPPIAFIVDSPWIPGYMGIDHIDYFLYPGKWFEGYRRLLDEWPEVTWVPGFWFEYGMALEPSAWGIRMSWHNDYPPSLEFLIDDPDYWAEAPEPNVYESGLLPFALRATKDADERLRAEGLKINLLCARGPIVTANWLMGAEALFPAMVTNPKAIHKFLDKITNFLIKWLHAQIEMCHEPEGFMIMDDLLALISVEHYYEFALPYLNRIFDEFEGMVRIYHNDAFGPHLDQPLTDMHFEIYQNSYQAHLLQSKEIMGEHCAIMGNIPPMQVVMNETPEMIYKVTHHYLNEAAGNKGLICSLGGGISAGTPVHHVEAMVQAWRDWDPHNIVPETDPEVIKYFTLGFTEQSDKYVARKGRRRRRSK